MSNHNFEMSLINGLCQQDNIDLKCVIIPGVYSFPYNNKRFYTSSEHYKYKNADIRSVSFCNLLIIKELWSIVTCAWQILKCTRQFRGSRIDVIMNTPDNRFFCALKIAKWFVEKRFTRTVIIPDIPSMVSSMSIHNFIKKFLLNRRNEVVMKKASDVDGLVLLTESMMDFVSKPVKHIVMEGIVDVDTMDMTSENVITDKQVILYTGTLRQIFGVMNLVNAFQQIPNKDVELWICGSGDAQNDIKDAANKDKRIKFWGLVDSKTALKMQCQATILVNPRTSEGEYTKYSFPSKTMEYLLTGRSVVINRLPGIPEEYYNPTLRYIGGKDFIDLFSGTNLYNDEYFKLATDNVKLSDFLNTQSNNGLTLLNGGVIDTNFLEEIFANSTNFNQIKEDYGYYQEYFIEVFNTIL